MRIRDFRNKTSIKGCSLYVAFLGKSLIGRSAELDVITIGQCLIFDEKIWQQGKDCFRENGYRPPAMLQVIPLMDREGRIFCFGWQDVEADRELRLLKEFDI